MAKEKGQASESTIDILKDDEVTKKLATLDIETFREIFPEQIKKLAALPGSNIGSSALGFLLEIADPYAAGTLRTYQHLSGKKELRLPYILPYDDKSTKTAIQNYIVRASGGGDIERVKVASKALEKCK